jgi:uncharacterized protein YaiE (UPF0345 family)
VSKESRAKFFLIASFLLVFFIAILVSATVNLESPADNAWTSTDNDTQAFVFNISTTAGFVEGQVECNLSLNSNVVAINSSVVNDTSTTLYSNTTFNQGANTWYVLCSNTTDTNQTATRTLNFDTGDPTADIETANHTWVYDTTPSISFNVTDALDTPIAYQFYVDDAADGVASGTATNASSSSDDLNTLSAGTHTVLVEATDEAGNKKNSTLITLFVDDVAPTVTLISPADNTNTTTAAQSLQFNVTDNLGSPYNCTLYIDGVHNTSNLTTQNATTTVFSITFDEGVHTWNVSCLDNASTQGSAVSTITVDQNPPVPIIETANHTWFSNYIGGWPTINFNVTDSFADPISYKFYVDGVADATAFGTVSNATSSNDDLTGPVNGTHTMILEGTDDAGNTLNSSEWIFYVDDVSPVVTPITADNSNFSSAPASLEFNVTDNMGGPYACTLYIDGVANNSNATTLNATTTELSFGAAEGSYTWTVNCTDNASNMGSSSGRTVKLDLAGGPVINSFTLAETDTFVHDISANDDISLRVNASDTGTGVYYVEANFTEMSGDIAAADYMNLTYNAGTGLWELNVTMDDSSSYDFESKNITIRAFDYIPQAQSAGQNYFTVTLYNMTTPPLQNPCLQFSTGTTDFSTETNFESIDFTVVVDWNYSVACQYYGPGANNAFNPIARVNFTGLNFSDDATVQKISGLENALSVSLTPDNNWGNSRVYINTTFFSELNTTATVALYNLPFDNAPNITSDVDAAGYNTGSVVYTPYTHPTFGTVGNLTFNVDGFSGYNISDVSNPMITVNAPVPNMTVAQGSTQMINVTVNGTGTQVSNMTVVLDSTTYYMGNMTCYNATGSEQMNCYFNAAGLSDGTHQFVVNAWDYGGSAPGNSNSTTWNFTSDSAAPSVTNNQSNVSSIVNSNTVILLNVSATDATNVSNVTANGVLMGNHTATNYNLTTTPAALGCTVSGTCTVTFNASDYFGQYNDSVVTSFLVDVGPPSVSNISVTNATNVSSSVAVNIQAAVSDPAGVASVTANGNTMYLLSGSIYHANLTAGNLGCAADATCTITINATDTLGNYNDTESTTYYVDDAAPAVTGLSANPSEVQSTGVFQFNATVNDASGISSVLVNGSTLALLSGAVYSNSTLTPTALSCPSGTCNLAVTATDIAGNTNSTVTTTITVDDTDPVASFTYNSTNLIKSSGSVTLNVTVTESNTVASVQANNQAMTQIGATSTWYITDTGTNLGCTSSGNCTVNFVANDTAGNSGSTSTTVQVDNDGPAVTSASVTNTTSGRAQIGIVVNIQATVSDSPAGMGTVSVNGSTMYLLSGTTWHANVSGTTLSCPANSVCNLAITATDALGNTNTTTTTSYTTDNTAPSNSTAFTASGTTTSSVSATMDEAAKCTVNYGTDSTNLSSSANSSSFSTSLSVSFSTSASTVYYYNITDCWDDLGNSQDLALGVFNFTTSAAGTTGGGGGSGGTSSSTTYDVGDITRAAGQWEIGTGDKVEFQHITNGYRGAHSIRVTKVTPEYAEFEIASTPKEVKLYIGESEDVDLDDDGTGDITVKLLDIVYSNVLLKVTSLVESKDQIELLPPRPRTPRTTAEPAVETAAEPVAAPEPVSAPVTAPAPAPAPVEAPVEDKKEWNLYYYVFGALVALVVIVLIIVLIFEHHRKKKLYNLLE